MKGLEQGPPANRESRPAPVLRPVIRSPSPEPSRQEMPPGPTPGSLRPGIPLRRGLDRGDDDRPTTSALSRGGVARDSKGHGGTPEVNHGLSESGQDRPEGLADLPRLHELRRARARAPTPGCSTRSRAGRSSAGPRARHQLLRHRQLYSDGTSEEILGRAIRDFARRDEVVIATKVFYPSRQGPQRQGPVAQGDHDRDRRQPPPARHGLRRPLPDPSLGLRDADRGDARSPARRGEGRQGAVHRRLLDVRLAILQGALPRRPPRLDAVRLDAEPLQPALSRGGARDDGPLRRRRASA